jgi:uncharacterized protein YutE (UPF0331/DUF86 family)
MRLELYLQETRRLAQDLDAMLDGVCLRLQNGQALSNLEQAGAQHALQLLIENAIGKSKMLLKLKGEVVPVSAYDAFAKISRLGLISSDQLQLWTSAIGLRNRIVHDYLNVDMALVNQIILKHEYKLQVAFLMADLPSPTK